MSIPGSRSRIPDSFSWERKSSVQPAGRRSRIIDSHWRKIWNVLRICIEFTRVQPASPARGFDLRRGRAGEYNRSAHARLRRFQFPLMKDPNAASPPQSGIPGSDLWQCPQLCRPCGTLRAVCLEPARAHIVIHIFPCEANMPMTLQFFRPTDADLDQIQPKTRTVLRSFYRLTGEQLTAFITKPDQLFA
jgi:hypothetical protein